MSIVERDEPGDRVWHNWAGNLTAHPMRSLRPATEQQALGAVRQAIRDGISIRVVGAGHSFSPLVPTDGLMLDLGELRGITGVDAKRRRVRALAGTQIRDFGDALWECGLSLSNQGDIDHQTIAGAIATATHGSGIELGSFSSTVRWVRLIDGRGDVIEVGEDRLRELLAAATSLGVLGVILEVELEVSPAYDLQEEILFSSWEATRDGWAENIVSNRHFSFFWCPADISPSLYGLEAGGGLPFADRTYAKRYARALEPDDHARSTDIGNRRDRSYRIYPDINPEGISEFHEVEYFVDARRGLEAVSAVRDLMRERYPDQLYPLEVRHVAAESSYLAPAFERPSTVLSVSGKPGTDYLPFLWAFDELLASFEARAHWGKIHFFDRARIERVYPEFATFVAVRREFDPNGIYLNEHTRALFD